MSEEVINHVALLQARAVQVAATGEFEAGFDGVVSSPCVNVCRMTPDRSHCQGCFRALEDIRQWSRSDASTRQRIWREALERAGVTQPRVPA